MSQEQSLLQEISFSKLSLLDRSPYLFYKRYILKEDIKEESDGLNIGSAVDCLLFTPDEFYNRFSICTKSSPTGQLENFVKKLIELQRNDEEAYNIAYEYTKSENGGKLRDTIEKFIERFEKEAKPYYLEKINSVDKIILSFEDFLKVQQSVNILKTNSFTSKYLSDTVLPNIERFYQVSDIFSIKDIQIKVILDTIIVDHENKTIQPLDIKTTSYSVYSFKKSIIKYRYDLQAAIYSLYIKHKFSEINHIKDYTILPFKFIVINPDYPDNPLIWVISECDLKIAEFGYKSDIVSIIGFWDLIDNLKWHIQNDCWIYNRYVYELNGELEAYIYEEIREKEK